MNNINLKIIFLLNISLLFVPKNCFTVSGIEDSSVSDLDDSNPNAEDSSMQESSRAQTSTLKSLKRSGSRQNIASETPELSRLSAENIRLSHEVFDLRRSVNELIQRSNSNTEQELKLVMFKQIKDAITHNFEENKKFVKEELIKFKKNINFQDNNGDTLLHYAYQIKNYKVIKYLIKNGADSTIENNSKIRILDKILELKNNKNLSHEDKKLLGALENKEGKFEKLKNSFRRLSLKNLNNRLSTSV